MFAIVSGQLVDESYRESQFKACPDRTISCLNSFGQEFISSRVSRRDIYVSGQCDLRVLDAHITQVCSNGLLTSPDRSRLMLLDEFLQLIFSHSLFSHTISPPLSLSLSLSLSLPLGFDT